MDATAIVALGGFVAMVVAFAISRDVPIKVNFRRTGVEIKTDPPEPETTAQAIEAT